MTGTGGAAGRRWRAMVAADEAAIVDLFQAEDRAHRGFSDFTLEMLREQLLQDSSFDTERDFVLVEEDGRLIASALFMFRFAIVDLHPDHEDPRLRAELIAWAERRQAEMGRTPYRVSTFAANAAAVGAIRTAGYELERVFTKMVRRFADTGPPDPVQVAAGYRLRRVDAGADAETLHALHERAFAERADHVPQPLDDYVRSHLSFSQFAGDWSLMVETTDGAPAGSLVGWRPPDDAHGYIAVLAVDPGHRRHGLGRAMLLEAFATIHAAGLPAAELHVASSDNSNAFRLYTEVGMHEDERFEHYIRTP